MGGAAVDAARAVNYFNAGTVEFLVDRGTPARYTRDVFGERLTVDERRLDR